MKENQWKMKGKPIQTEKQKKSQTKNKKIPKKIRTHEMYHTHDIMACDGKTLI